MTFNDNANIGDGKVSRRGRTGLVVGGGGGALLVVGLFIVSQLLGVDLTGLAGGGTSDTPADNLTQCATGADANRDLDCRMKGAAAALDSYWVEEAPKVGIKSYTSPQFALFSGSTDTGCGTASSATGPFYCPADQILYVDTSFFDELKNTYGSSGGPLAQMYVVAHEWGHHIQKLAGILDRANSSATGPASQSVRVELQADCFAGAWVGSASTVPDENGVPFLKSVSEGQIADALSAASAVGDDRIQSAGGGQVNRETWTHGSSEQRTRWFTTGFKGGATACDTFSPTAAKL